MSVVDYGFGREDWRMDSAYCHFAQNLVEACMSLLVVVVLQRNYCLGRNYHIVAEKSSIVKHSFCKMYAQCVTFQG